MMGHVDAKGNYKCEMKPNPLNAAPPPQDAEQVAPQCCRDQVPLAGGKIPDGHIWACPTCKKKWVHDTDEATGSAWWPQKTSVVAPQAAGEIERHIELLESALGVMLKDGHRVDHYDLALSCLRAHVAKIAEQREIIEQLRFAMHFGDEHHKQSMRIATAALSAAAKDEVGR
jgi:hypothetical protein